MRLLREKKRPVNGLLIITIMAAGLLYNSYMKENQYMNKQLKVFSHIGHQSEEDNILEVSSSEKFGYIRPQVVDGFNEEPIEGAVVVIPETNEKYKTDENGYTPNIRIKISPDSSFEKIHPKSWGETTLIVYKEGYREYVLLDINVWEGQTRQGPIILLFKKESQQLDQPMSIVEGPNQVWINSLVEKYRP